MSSCTCADIASFGSAVFDDDGAVVGGPDEVHLAARAELAAMRDILASLQPRIVRAEALLNALPPPERAGKRRRLSTDREVGMSHTFPVPPAIADTLPYTGTLRSSTERFRRGETGGTAGARSYKLALKLQTLGSV